MANEKNLIPTNKRSKSEASELGRKGGIKSGKTRREKKVIREILSGLLDSEIKNQPQFAKIAAKLGIQSGKSVKELFTLICLLNSVKSGNLQDLEKLSLLLGEDKGEANNGILEELTEYLKPKDVK